MQRLCVKQHMDPKTLVFIVDGERVDPRKTPADLDLDDEARLRSIFSNALTQNRRLLRLRRRSSDLFFFWVYCQILLRLWGDGKGAANAEGFLTTSVDGDAFLRNSASSEVA